MLTSPATPNDFIAPHPLWLRVVHALNAVAVLVMVASGWRIYDASPFFGFTIPAAATLGGWLAGAVQWHFAAMWLLMGNGLTYLAIALMGGRLRRRLWPLSPRGLWRDLLAALHGRLGHGDPRHYNQIQKLAYLFAMADLVLLVLSGLVLWKSVQFPLLRDALGGYESARRVHFLAMGGIVSFVAVHVVMALSVPRTLRAMFLGR